jgi:hypothetical protein
VPAGATATDLRGEKSKVTDEKHALRSTGAAAPSPGLVPQQLKSPIRFRRRTSRNFKSKQTTQASKHLRISPSKKQ